MIQGFAYDIHICKNRQHALEKAVCALSCIYECHSGSFESRHLMLAWKTADKRQPCFVYCNDFLRSTLWLVIDCTNAVLNLTWLSNCIRFPMQQLENHWRSKLTDGTILDPFQEENSLKTVFAHILPWESHWLGHFKLWEWWATMASVFMCMLL